jgi:hypothetical protein
MGQLHEFSIIQTNVQVHEKCQKDENGDCGAHSYCRYCRPYSKADTVMFYFCASVPQFERSCPTATKSTYIDTPSDRKTHYRLDLQIEHANESGT